MAANGANPYVSTLAEEIVCNIAARLGSDDLFALRLTCTALEAKTFHEFANEYFTSKCVHFTTDSLKSLLRTTESKRLRPYLREVYVSSKMFCEDALDIECSSGCSHKSSGPSVVSTECDVLDDS